MIQIHSSIYYFYKNETPVIYCIVYFIFIDEYVDKIK